MKITAKSTRRALRLAITGGAILGLAAITFVMSSVASAVEYNLVEATGAVTGPPSMGIYLGLWGAVVLAAVGFALLLIALASLLLHDRSDAVAG